MGRRSEHPKRIVQGRPRAQAAKLIRETVNNQDKEQTTTRKEIARTTRYTNSQERGKNMKHAQKQRKRNRDAVNRTDRAEKYQKTKGKKRSEKYHTSRAKPGDWRTLVQSYSRPIYRNRRKMTGETTIKKR